MQTAEQFIPYGHQCVEEDDIAAVVEVLRSDWLTTGPRVGEFEERFARHVGSKEAVAVSSGTAALHAAMYAIGIGPGDEVILPPMTFAATANAIAFQGGTPVFVDVDPGTLLIDPDKIAAKITPRTKAVIAVDYAGQPFDYDALRSIAEQKGIALVADACHALGAVYKGCPVGSLADLTVFSFHPVKHITTGEGGMVTTDSSLSAERMRTFRNHGITTDHHQREKEGSWFYEMVDLGYNYRLTDLQSALGMSQLRKLPVWINRRREIAARYDEALAGVPGIAPLGLRADVVPAERRTPGPRASTHVYHLYVVRVDFEALEIDRAEFFRKMREGGIGINVHYIPVHLHPFYRRKFHTTPGLCPSAEEAYEQIVSLPIFPKMTGEDVERVVACITKSSEKISR
jgi:perosamine synthetase